MQVFDQSDGLEAKNFKFLLDLRSLNVCHVSNPGSEDAVGPVDSEGPVDMAGPVDSLGPVESAT